MEALLSQSASSGPALALARLSWRERWGYACGEVASNLTWNMVAGFLLLYYTDVALLPVGALGTLMLVTRVLDAVFDPAVGLMVDRTASRWGRARPYLLFLPLPFAALAVATFSIPAGWAMGAKLAYAYVTFGLLGLLYSLLYIPYGALLPMMTRNPVEKVRLGSLRSMGTSAASIFVYSLTMPLVGWVSAETDAQTGFTVAAAVMGGVTVLLYYVVYFSCQERYVADADAPRTPVLTSLGQMWGNRTWRLTFALALVSFVRIGVMVTSVAYFAKDVMGAPWLMSVLLPILSVAILTGGFIAGFWFRRIGLRMGNSIAVVISIALTLLMPLAQGSIPLLVTLFGLSNIVGGLQGTTIFISIANATEDHHRRHANSAEGLLMSSVSFGMKVGMAIGAAFAAYVLAWAGYDPGHVTDGTRQAIAWLFYGGAVALMLAQLICVSFFKAGEPQAASAQSERNTA